MASILESDQSAMKKLLSRNDNMVVWTSEEFFHFWSQQNPRHACSLVAYPIEMRYQGSLVMHRNSQLTPLVNYQLLKLIQSGTLARIRTTYMGFEHSCEEENDDVVQSFADVIALFHLLGFGILLAVVVSGLECLRKLSKT